MKKIGIALVPLLVMAAVLSIRAHAADPPQTVIDTDGSGITIYVRSHCHGRISNRHEHAGRKGIQA